MEKEHKYQMSVYCWGGTRETFVISAVNKQDALNKGRLYVLQNPKYTNQKYDTNDIRCEKKLKKWYTKIRRSRIYETWNVYKSG